MPSDAMQACTLDQSLGSPEVIFSRVTASALDFLRSSRHLATAATCAGESDAEEISTMIAVAWLRESSNRNGTIIAVQLVSPPGRSSRARSICRVGGPAGACGPD